MNASEGKSGVGSLIGPVTELLKNPLIIEGAIAGISAITAARRAKNPKPSGSGPDISSIIELLPEMLPLLSMFSSSSGVEGATDEVTPTASEDADVSVFAEDEVEDGLTEEAAPTLSGSVFNGTRRDKRENLLLALRPFLSESRAAAADAIIQVNRISGLFGT